MHDNTMTCTRPDIAYVVGRLGRHISSPGKEHWDAINRVFKYLKQTMDYGLEYSGDPSVLEGYTDASWITDQADYASTSEWIFTLGGGNGLIQVNEDRESAADADADAKADCPKIPNRFKLGCDGYNA
ncbi:hypothetical protein Tco_0834723 [Tanacetum coccineum]